MIGDRTPERAEVPDALLGRVLAPYKPHCRYLRQASVEYGSGDPLCRIQASFSIRESCYIDDTGHLNAVEVNICYNQMLYTLYAMGIEHRFILPLARIPLETWLERQLPDVLIHRLDMSFKSPIDPREFRGELSFLDAAEKRGYILFPSRCAFRDAAGGLATGNVTAVVDSRGRGRVKGKSGPGAGELGGS